MQALSRLSYGPGWMVPGARCDRASPRLQRGAFTRLASQANWSGPWLHRVGRPMAGGGGANKHPMDGADGGNRTRDIDHGKVALCL